MEEEGEGGEREGGQTGSPHPPAAEQGEYQEYSHLQFVVVLTVLLLQVLRYRERCQQLELQLQDEHKELLNTEVRFSNYFSSVCSTAVTQ